MDSHKLKDLAKKGLTFDKLVQRYPTQIKELIANLRHERLLEAPKPVDSNPIHAATSPNDASLDGLPAELRVEIFKFALTADEPIFICRYKDRKRHDSATALWNAQDPLLMKTPGWMAKPKMGWHLSNYPVVKILREPVGSVYVRRPAAMRFAQYCAPSLLRVCETFYREAYQILYAENKFVFEDPNALEDFIATTNGAINFFTDLSVHISRATIKGSTIAPVFEAHRLRRITFIAPPAFWKFQSKPFASSITEALAAPDSECMCKRARRVCTCLTAEDRECRIRIVTVEHKYGGIGMRDPAAEERDSEKVREMLRQLWVVTVRYADTLNRSKRKVSLESFFTPNGRRGS